MSFLDEKYLLSSEVGLAIYTVLKDLPIIDPHNHANVGEIAANRNYANPWQLFAATDHYVWEMLRKRGVPEEFITGDKDPLEKWMMMAEVFPELAGNPVLRNGFISTCGAVSASKLFSVPQTGLEIWNGRPARFWPLQKSAPQQLLKKDERGSHVLPPTTRSICFREHDEVTRFFRPHRPFAPTWRPGTKR